MKKNNILLVASGVLLFTGCCKKLELVDCNTTTPIKQTVKPSPVLPPVKQFIKIEAKGMGVVPCEDACSKAQAEAMARRAAILDAYKQLSEKIYGVKINGRDTVRNMILQNSILKTYVTGIIKGATIEEEIFKNGIYTVSMSLKLDMNKWFKLSQMRLE